MKFASNQEFEYISNWKILQKAFKAAGVDKVRVNDFLLLMLILDFDMVSTQSFDIYLILFKVCSTKGDEQSKAKYLCRDIF